MRAVWKKDLQNYFHSPVGYGFIIVFSTVMNFFFYLFNILGGSDDVRPLFSIMLFLLMLLLPLLTMRLLAEEHRQKTDQMFYAYPVPMWKVVIGKFFSAVTVVALGLALTGFWGFFLARYGVLVLVSMLGQYTAILFAAAAFLSIGLLLSAVTESQFIAAAGTFAVYFVLYSLNSLSAAALTPGLKSGVVWFSLFLRYQRFALGVFSVTDIFFYFTFTALMLFLTAHVMERRQ